MSPVTIMSDIPESIAREIESSLAGKDAASELGGR